MLEVWKVMGNSCSGKDADITFYGQSTNVLKVEGKKDAYIAMLPIKFNGDSINIAW